MKCLTDILIYSLLLYKTIYDHHGTKKYMLLTSESVGISANVKLIYGTKNHIVTDVLTDRYYKHFVKIISLSPMPNGHTCSRSTIFVLPMGY